MTDIWKLWLLVDLVFYPVVILLYLIWLRRVVNTRIAIMQKKKKGHLLVRVSRKNRTIETHIAKPDSEGKIEINLGGNEKYKKTFKVKAENIFYDPMFDAWVVYFNEDETEPLSLGIGKSNIDSTYNQLMILKAYQLGRQDSVEYMREIGRYLKYALYVSVVVLIGVAVVAYLQYNTMQMIDQIIQVGSAVGNVAAGTVPPDTNVIQVV